MAMIFSRFFVFLVLFVVLFLPASAFAQNNTNSTQSVAGEATLGVAHMVDTNLKDLKDGMILSSSEKGAVLSHIPYDSQVLGIVARDAAIIISSTTSENGVPVISQGKVYILVSSLEGNIKKGDLITTSTLPGIAVKSTKSGYVLGTALEDYSNSNTKQTDKIAVDLDLHYFNTKPTLLGSLTDIFKFALLPAKDSPTAIFKYLFAAAVALGSFILGFMTFGRTAAKGVEALGRNPSASKIIHLGIILNVSVVVIIVLAGLTVSFLILRL